MKIRSVNGRSDVIEITKPDGQVVVQAIGGYAAQILALYRKYETDDEFVAVAIAIAASYGLLHQARRELETIDRRAPSPEAVAHNLRLGGAL